MGKAEAKQLLQNKVVVNGVRQQVNIDKVLICHGATDRSVSLSELIDLKKAYVAAQLSAEQSDG